LIDVVVIDTPSLGDRSYLVTDGTAALVVDPQRDIDRILVAAADRGVQVTHVFETHIHNDYVSGGLALARETGAAYHVNGADNVAFGRDAISGGDEIESGTMRVGVLATPGHTWTHLAYAVMDAVTGDVAGVFTGGSLLHGSTGRPDLLGARHARALASAQHASARRLASLLPGHTPVFPTHGFGGSCAAGRASGRPAQATIAGQQRANPALTLGEDRYVASVLAGLDAVPGYYARMGPANMAGADAPVMLPPEPARPADVGAGEHDDAARMGHSHRRGDRDLLLAVQPGRRRGRLGAGAAARLARRRRGDLGRFQLDDLGPARLYGRHPAACLAGLPVHRGQRAGRAHKTVPADLYEAARVDGASPWRVFWKITYPLLKPIFLVLLLLSVIWDFGVFTQLYILTGSGANLDEYNLGIYVYQRAFSTPPSYGLGGALALVLTAILLIITVGYVRASIKQGALR
jgi:glyoxylase-like metal-dependent hydrolase (beta-lactamase superfamily II)